VARRRAQPAPATEPVVWRDGVHVAGTPIWCDARRARDLCFVSAADRVGRAGHGQLIATAATLAQLGAAPGPHLAVPYRRPFTLGTLRLELMPSGHALGADAAYPWSNAADRGRLLALIAATGAARVYLTGRSAEAVAHALGAPARVLAAPRQLGLFDEARR
jgi:hypothetical protein